MRRSLARPIVNRRRIRRRRRALVAPRTAVQPLFRRIRPYIRRLATDSLAMVADWRNLVARRFAEALPRLRQARESAIFRLRLAVNWTRIRSQRAVAVFRQAWMWLAQQWRMFLQHAIAWRGRLRAAALREVEPPRLGFAPVFQVAAALFALVAVSTAVFTGWQILHGHPETPKPAAVAQRDHHPTLAGADVAVRAQTDDVDSAVRDLAAAPERALSDAADVVASSGDIDAKNWFDSTATPEPEEKLAATFTPLPRAESRPEPPLAAGIPIKPEPPFGTAPAEPAWLANAVPVNHVGKRPMIAIVIDDAGVAQAHTRRAIQLPAPLTIAFIPYSRDLERQAEYAHSRGHELLLHMPMEPISGAEDPGRNALLTTLSQAEIMRRFRWALGRFHGYVGVNNHMGSKFMARADLLRPVLQEIQSRGLLFLDSRTDHTTVGGKLAADMGMPHASRNVFLDNVLDADKIRQQLTELERIARRHGEAIAIGHPHDVTIDVLAKWIPEARRKGFQLVPVSAIVKRNYDLRLASAAAGGKSDRLLGSAQ